MEKIVIEPVGRVISDVNEPKEMPLGGRTSTIEVFEEYQEALKGIEENSHIWILAWFHKAPRNILKTSPKKVNPNLPEYGVFALRSFTRPNPVAMCLAKLEKVEGNYLYVSGLDAINGTPVVDIKPYYENDTIFSPLTPYIKGQNRGMRRGFIQKHALNHHQEECNDLLMAVRMAAIAEESLGHLNSPDLFVKVQGSACLVDSIQGITRARMSNPARLVFTLDKEVYRTIWTRGQEALIINCKDMFTRQEILDLPDSKLFDIRTS